MTRRILSQRVARYALMAAPAYNAEPDAWTVRSQQIANDFQTLKALGFDDGAAYCLALMVGGVLAGRLGGPFDGAVLDP